MAKKQVAGGLIAKLQQAMRNSGKSLNQLSREAGVSVPQLSRFVLGERTLTLPAAEKLCAALHLDLVIREEMPAKKRRHKGDSE
jgi:transcriptional regulator with XRE-family HTH domain